MEKKNVGEYSKVLIKFLQKYFWKGQHLEEKHANKLESLAANASWQEKMLHQHRRLIGFLIPMIFFVIIWLTLAVKHNLFQLFPEKYEMSLTMVFGALIAGFYAIDPYLSPPQKKMFFVSIWFSFAVALFLNNYKREHKMCLSIQNVNWMKIAVLLFAGFMGGIFTSFSGSGVDICSFSVLTLLFNVSEKVATPTSVVLMAINTIVGFYWRQLIIEGVEQDAWEYVAVCVPIVVVCAPFGTVLSSHFHRHVLAAFIYIIEIIALVSAFIIVRPGWTLTLVSIGIMLVGFTFFCTMRYVGHRMHKSEMQSGDADLDLDDVSQNINSSVTMSTVDGQP